jgi:cytochrome c oxidase assembly protein subunit 15
VGEMATSLPRPRAIAISAGAFRRIALANALMLIVVVSTGTTVRLTGSGLGCKHWPGCQPGDPLPTQGFHSVVEFSNRIVAGITIVVTLATLLASLLTAVPVWVRWLAAGTFLGTLAQAPLGAITVYYDLNPWLVGTHFLLSLLVLTLAVLVAVAAYGLRGEPVPARIAWLGLLVGAAGCALVVTGMLATAAGPHSGSVAVPRIGSFQPAIWLHVRATAVFGISFAILIAWLATRHSRHLRGALVVLGLLVLQMAVGEIQYRTELPWWLVLVHVTLSGVVWAAMTWFVALLWRPGEPSRMAR